ncbi:MAG: ATP-binding protein [Armatimonadetes bacterium]|nr:ATP-binding protein [Armatimonadota bacterium]
MLISFSIENWMSFRDKVSFSMIASRERQHGQRVPRLTKYKTGVLPVAAIYGGNASGKTNLFKALYFVQDLVVKGTHPNSLILVEPFRLDAKMADQPTRVAIELLIDEIIYEFSFAVTRKAVLEEKLTRITSAGEIVLYDRHDGKPNFAKSLKNNAELLGFAFQGTRENQLFLTNSVSQNVKVFEPVYKWFAEKLELVAPNTRFGPYHQLLKQGHPLAITINELLPQLDTGITHLGGEEIPFDSLTCPESMKVRLREEVKEGVTVALRADPMNERFVISRKNGELVVQKLVAFHPKQDGNEVKFEIQEESDGSQRIIDLLPAFLKISERNSDNVYVIDELDRSLHTLLTRQLLEAYLSNCSHTSRSQLLFTTHDVLLMDQQLLRRDEMWVTERDSTGNTSLLSFSDYKDVRYDKDIRKSYLQGRLGGIPRLLTGSPLMRTCGLDNGRND